MISTRIFSETFYKQLLIEYKMLHTGLEPVTSTSLKACFIKRWYTF